MNKKELVKKVAEAAELTESKAEKALTALVKVVTEAMKDDVKVQLLGLGTFEVVNKKEREGLNPRTKEKIKIPARKSVKFKSAKALKDSLL